ncbi:MAG: transketolase [Solirubrobacteraceae bacterium]|nr:transketolase [Solirubrobacteraceae bacterium]
MSAPTEQASLEKLSVDTIRTLSMDGVEKANSGHPGTPMALAPVVYSLFAQVMKHDPADPHWLDRDRFVLSAGHASMLQYSILHLTGYDVSMDDLKQFRQLESRTPGHPEKGHTEGVETTTGPLGQGISTAVGLALAERMLNARFGDIVDHHVFVIASDGDMQEGIQAEAASLAGHLDLSRLIVFYDDNHISIEGDTAKSFSEDVGKRYEAYGWEVVHLGEDIEVDTLTRAFTEAKETDRPTLIIGRTHIGYGAPNKQDTGSAHGSPLGDDEIKAAKEFYGFPSDEPFFVPDGVYDHYKEVVADRAKAHEEWQERFADDDGLAELERMRSNELPDGWDAEMQLKTPEEEESLATRKASEAAIQWAAKAVPELVGGSADLAGSTNTLIDGADSVEAGAYSGRNLHFGIREHGMGAIVNGLTLSGFRAYGATFLTFSDYMKGAIRMAAIMECPSIFVFTHDSIGLGEDGPTHQPIEQLTHLRATPKLNVVRPADYNETQLAWRFALRTTNRPTAFSLSRQGAPTLNPEDVPDDAIERGAYVLRDSDGDPDVILIGTGTEVSLALEAADQLDDLDVRVVSMPCMDTFGEQDAEYRDRVLPPDVKARVAVEAASPFSWYRWVGDCGGVIGMTDFGASAPAKDVYEHFGITADAVAQAARESVEKARS